MDMKRLKCLVVAASYFMLATSSVSVYAAENEMSVVTDVSDITSDSSEGASEMAPGNDVEESFSFSQEEANQLELSEEGDSLTDTDLQSNQDINHVEGVTDEQQVSDDNGLSETEDVSEDVPVVISDLSDTEPDAYVMRSPSLKSGNHIYFYNVEDTALSGDMILVESKGRWGLIDAGHRYSESITDEMGNVWPTTLADLSCQTKGKNGRDAMIYLVETLGVNHLDFIIGTHAHSDHIGGIPEIAELKVGEEDGSVHSLIDESTVYFYKSYFHTGSQDDDLGSEKIKYSWHNQAFYYEAKQSVIKNGGKLVDVSCGIKTKEGKEINASQSTNLSNIKAAGGFSNVSYQPRSQTNPFDDRLSFSWGDMNINLYNLFAVDGALNDNVNSIVVVITCGRHKVYMAGDMNTWFRTEQKLAKIIASDHGHIDIVKMSHHGHTDGSNSKGLIDSLQPKLMVSTNCWKNLSNPTPSGGYSSVKYYSARNYGTVIYGAGLSDYALGVDLDSKGLSVFELKGVGERASTASAERCKDQGKVKDGWSAWCVEFDTNAIIDWYYFENNKPVTGWKIIGGKWYYFDSSGFMASNEWVKSGSKWYWLTDSGKMAANQWVLSSGVWYYIKSDGSMASNEWVWSGSNWYWMNDSGQMAANQWVWSGNAWYYMKSNGCMAANEWVHSGSAWYWMNGTGQMVSNRWIWTGVWYYMKSNGCMAANEWIWSGSNWYWMNSSGSMAANQWIYTGGEWYYLKSNGVMAASEWVVDSSNWYWMSKSGKLVLTQAKR